MTMKINLNDYERTAQPNFRGGKGEYVSRMLNDGTNKVIWGMLAPGHSIGMHTHETNSEIMHVLSGTARVVMDGQIEYVHAGQTHYCPKGHSHMTEPYGMQELVLLAVVPEQ